MNTINDASIKDLEVFFKALSHPARLAILEELRFGDQCVCHLEAVLGFRQSYISQQLAVLREAGMITDRRDGWNVYYQVKDMRVFDLLDTAYQINGREPHSRKKMTECVCPRCNQNKLEDDRNGEYKGTGIRVC